MSIYRLLLPLICLAPSQINAEELRITLGEPVVVDQYDGSPTDANAQTFHFGGLLRAGNGNLIALYRLRPDELLPDGVDLDDYHKNDVGYRISKDNGRTWGPRRFLSYGGVDGGTLPDGTVLVTHFRTYWVNDHECRTVIHRSTDGGESWTTDDDVRIRFPEDRALTKRRRGQSTIRFWCATIQAKDSTNMIASIHGRQKDRDHSHTYLVESKDGGHTWDFVSCIAGDRKPSHLGYFGGSIARLDDGSLLAVVQTEYATPRIIVQCRSQDGSTWTNPVNCPNIAPLDPRTFGYTTPDGRKSNFSGAFQHPQLLRMGNGVLALNYGRPGVHVSFSSDGRGKKWDSKVTIVPHGARYSNSLFGASSHKQQMVALAPNKLLLLYDVYRYGENESDPWRNTVFVREITVERKEGGGR